MDTFLIPQTLTNMSELNAGQIRVSNVKPFVPFASITGFDVNVQNAGAGAFAHKTATLKITIHDKNRISEFSELIRGSSGFAGTDISTVYGWAAPQNRNDDGYSKFINEKMRIVEHWKVKDSQFSFDAGGQVQATVNLLSQPAAFLSDVSMSADIAEMQSFNEAIKHLKELKAFLIDKKVFASGTRFEKFLNDATGENLLKEYNAKSVKAIMREIRELAKKQNIDGLSDKLKALDEVEKDIINQVSPEVDTSTYLLE